jgi:membrane protein required for colicin V production
VNWLDWLIIGFVGLSVIGGFREGFIRLGIGFVALIVGFICAAWFYGLAADPLVGLVKTRMLANFLGFFMIFGGVMLTGSLLAALIARAFKLVGLSPVDRVLGGAFGLVRGSLVVIIATMCLMAFAPSSLPGAVERSTLAPYIIRSSRALTSVAPYDLRQGFNRTFDRVQGMIKELRDPQKLIIRQE